MHAASGAPRFGSSRPHVPPRRCARREMRYGQKLIRRLIQLLASAISRRVFAAAQPADARFIDDMKI